MTDEQILQRISEIVAEILELDDLALSMTSTARDVDGWDSVTNVQIMVAIEQAFGTRFRTGELTAMKNVGDLVRRVGRS